MTPHHPRGDEPPPSTELDALRRENAELRVRLRESQESARRPIDEAKSEFLANISHELRTPLNGILGMLQIMSTTELSGEQRDCVETALDSSRTLLWVLNDILEFTRVSCEGMTLVHKPFDPRAVADSVIQAFRHRATLKGLSLTLAVHDAVSKVLVGDGGRVRQILFHLVGNAVKFTSQGQVRLEISALPPGRDPRQKAILFQVSDSGIGIPDDRLERIFVPFSQADGSASRRHQGLVFHNRPRGVHDRPMRPLLPAHPPVGQDDPVDQGGHAPVRAKVGHGPAHIEEVLFRGKGREGGSKESPGLPAMVTAKGGIDVGEDAERVVTANQFRLILDDVLVARLGRKPRGFLPVMGDPLDVGIDQAAAQGSQFLHEQGIVLSLGHVRILPGCMETWQRPSDFLATFFPDTGKAPAFCPFPKNRGTT